MSKKCPRCNGFALYDDDVLECPDCHSQLVAYQRTYGRTTEPVAESRPVVEPRSVVRQSTQESTRSRQEIPPFETRNGLGYVYRGTVTEINHHDRYHSRLKKVIYSMFRGEPYQFGHTSHESVFRVEGFHEGRLSGPKKDFIFYGDVEGRFNFGDDVTVFAKRRGDRNVVTKMFLNETETRVYPTPQIPAALCSIIFFVLLAVVVYVVAGIVSFITSGLLMVWIRKLIVLVVELAILYFIAKSLWRNIFRR